MECERRPGELSWLDGSVIALYLLLVLGTAFSSLFRSGRNTVSGYFLAGRFMWWLPVGASIFATNIGSEHFIGLAGSGAADGIAVAAFELNVNALLALVLLQVLGWVFLPVYIASGVHTLPEYMHKRLGGSRIRVYLACMSLCLYVFIKMSVTIYSGSIFVQELFGWNLWLCILLILAVTALCTVSGGLAAVIYMDTLQCFLMIGAACVLAGIAFTHIGGYPALVRRYMHATAANVSAADRCGVPSPHSFTMLRAADDPEYPWLGFIVGQTPSSLWFWATDQYIVQRALASKSLSHAQGATLFAGLLKITPLFIIVMPGMIARVLCPDELACVTDCFARCGNAAGCSNLAYPKLILGLMPDGLRGVMLAGMLSALMSDLTSIFNSAASLFTLDIWTKLRPNPSAREMLIVGRVWVAVMVVVAVLWVPVISMRQGGQIFIYIQHVAADLTPPVTAVYVCALLTTITNEKGAFFGLLLGTGVGAARMGMEFIYDKPGCPLHDDRPLFVRLQYMYFSLVLFSLTVASTLLISVCTPPLPPHMLYRTTYWTRHDRRPRPDDHKLVEADDDEGEVVPMPRLQHHSDQSDEDDESSEGKPEKRAAAASAKCNTCLDCVSWFFGFKKDSASDIKKLQVHLDEITGLAQSRRQQQLLNALLVLLLLLAAALYIYFSLVTPGHVARYAANTSAASTRSILAGQ